jgi:Transposase protein
MALCLKSVNLLWCTKAVQFTVHMHFDGCWCVYIFHRWLESVDAKPGLNRSILNMLASRHAANPQLYTTCSLQIDAMAIRQHISFDSKSQKMTGFVDLGFGDSSADEAKEVLVLLAVGTTGHWKTPVAYYCTRSLSAETQKQLVAQAIDELEQAGLQVVSLVMDGLWQI